MVKGGALLEKLKEREHADSLLEKDRQAIRARSEAAEIKAKYEAAIRTIGELEQRVSLHTALSSRKPPQKPEKPKRSKASSATALLVLSDWHVEETVEPEKVNGLNEFNLEIAASSIKQTFEKALVLLEDARNLADIKHLVVAVLGDVISGHIHEELVENNSLAPLPATMFAAEHLEAGLKMLLDHGGLDQITVPTCYGNHGRTTKKSRYSTGAENSFEHNLYLHLQRRFDKDSRIRWQVSPGYHNWLDVEGFPVRFHHGDAINYWGGVGGITVPVNKAISQWNKSRRAAYDIFGHFHQWVWSWNWICNGSLIGYGPFSLRIKGDYQPPLQTFAVIDRERGLTRALPIYCR